MPVWNRARWVANCKSGHCRRGVRDDHSASVRWSNFKQLAVSRTYGMVVELDLFMSIERPGVQEMSFAQTISGGDSVCEAREASQPRVNVGEPPCTGAALYITRQFRSPKV